MKARRQITADGFEAALRLLADEPNRDLRAARATAFMYALRGLHYFPRCSSLVEVCQFHRVSRSTVYSYLAEMAANGFSWAPSVDDLPGPARLDSGADGFSEGGTPIGAPVSGHAPD